MSENESPGNAELGSILGCRMAQNQFKSQAQLILKAHHSHKLDPKGTMLPKDGHDNGCHKKKKGSREETRGDWSCLPLPGGWETAHLRSPGNGLKEFKSITCVSILSKDIDEDISISPCTNDITSVHFDFILVTWK